MPNTIVASSAKRPGEAWAAQAPDGAEPCIGSSSSEVPRAGWSADAPVEEMGCRFESSNGSGWRWLSQGLASASSADKCRRGSDRSIPAGRDEHVLGERGGRIVDRTCGSFTFANACGKRSVSTGYRARGDSRRRLRAGHGPCTARQSRVRQMNMGAPCRDEVSRCGRLTSLFW